MHDSKVVLFKPEQLYWLFDDALHSRLVLLEVLLVVLKTLVQ